MPGGNVTSNGRPICFVGFMTLACMVLGLLIAAQASAQDGDLTEERWTKAESPVLVDGMMEIDGDTRLVIEAGVEVRFDEDAQLVVKGELSVEGTEAEPVMFTSNTTGDIGPNLWRGVQLHQDSADRHHRIWWAVFEGADAGLTVRATTADLEDCVFFQNRNGLLAIGEARVDLMRCTFTWNSVLGLEWQAGATGTAQDCKFLDTAVGVYCYEGSSPTIEDCDFQHNYHHMSFATGANATVRRCTLNESTAEALECYWNSSPVLIDVTIEGEEPPRIYLSNGSRPRMLRGTNASTLRVDVTDGTSYIVVLKLISVHVTSDEGKDLVDANMTIGGASGDVLWSGATGEGGKAPNVLMSIYTVDGDGASVREHPHEAHVEWKGHNQTFSFGPDDLNDDEVLELEMALSSPEPGGWGWLPYIIILFIFSVIILGIGRYYQERDR